MTVTDLIIELAKLPPDMEVVYDNTQNGDDGFRLVIVENIGEIMDEKGNNWILLNYNDIEDDE